MIAMEPNEKKVTIVTTSSSTAATTPFSPVSKSNEEEAADNDDDDEDSYLTIDGVYSDDDEEDEDDDNDEKGEEARTKEDDDGTCSIVDANEIKKTVDDNNNTNDKFKKEHDEDDDNDDDDDDNVTITINAEKLKEHSRLTKLLRTNQLDALDQNQVQQYVETDLELQREIEMIVRESIQPNTSKCVTVMLNNQIILIPNNIRISDRLTNYIWGTPKQYTNQLFPYSHEFDLLLKGLSETAINRRMFIGIPSAASNATLPKTFAIFAVRYIRTNCLAPKSQQRSDPLHMLESEFNRVLINTNINHHNHNINNNNNSNNTNNHNNFNNTFLVNSSSNNNVEKKVPTIMGLYQYCDFSIIMIRNNCVVDYAIHGVHSNIAEVIELHKPEVVYYNAQPGDALDTFIKYEWQPFYECLRNIAKPISIYRNVRELFNTLPFCQRYDTFCAFCHALRDTRSLIAQPWQVYTPPLPPIQSSPPPPTPRPLMSLPTIVPIHHKQYSMVAPLPPSSSSSTTSTLRRYEPYRRTRNKNVDWKYYARSRRPRRLSLNRFNYNSNCASFRF